MSLFKEFDGVQEVEEPSTATTKTELTNTNTLSQLVTQCGIPSVEDISNYPCSPASSLDSDMESHQNLIDELEEFFGSPTVIDDEASKDLELLTKTSVVCQPDPNSILDALVTGQVFNNNSGVQLTNKPQEILYDNQITSCVTEDGQNVIIIIAPPSPTASVTSSPVSPATSTTSCYDTDPEWVPSPSNNSLSSSPPTNLPLDESIKESNLWFLLVVHILWKRKRGRKHRTGPQHSDTGRRRKARWTRWKTSWSS